MGLSKVYEVILNNNPSYAFLLDTNSEVQNLFIVAHCLGHSDFFKNNCMFKRTDRNMISHAAEHAGRIESYIERYGFEKVERIMDIGFALDSHIDWHKGLYRKKYPQRRVETIIPKCHEFDDLLDKNKQFKPIKKVVNNKIPPHPEKDLLWFLINYAPLESWEADILDIIREESYYFYPQKMSKILDEGWACVCPESLVFVPNFGLIEGREIIEDKIELVIDGSDKSQKVTDYYNSRKKCKTIQTKKGFKLSGALQHRIQVWENGNRKWKEINELSKGDLVEIRYGQNCWHNEYQKINFSITPKTCGKFRNDFRSPEILDEEFARFLGYFSAEGHIGKRCLTITNGDEVVVDDIVKCVKNVFNIDITPRKDGSRWRVEVYSIQVIALLEGLGALGKSKEKKVPKLIFKSPKSVVEAYLSTLFTGDGGSYNDYILYLSSSSIDLVNSIQMLLLNFGIVSTISVKKKDGYSDNYHLLSSHPIFNKKFANIVNTTSLHKKNNLNKWARIDKKFGGHDRIYLNTSEKKSLLKITNKIPKFVGVNSYFYGKEYISKEQLFLICMFSPEHVPSSLVEKLNDNFFIDEITEISEVFISEVIDFTVDESHNYQAQGFVNHNSYWHAEIMYQYDGLSPTEYIDFVRDHEKVVQPGWNPFRINPYFLGYKIFKDIEKRWDKKYGEGAGREKIFEVRKNEDDISFLRNYLTADLVRELKLFTYGYFDDSDEDEKYIEIKGRILDDIIENLTKPLYNNGVPRIVINEIGQEGSLILKHDSEEVGTLNQKYAGKVIEYIWDLWAAPIELHMLDDNGDNIVLCFDESGVSFRKLDEELSFEEEDDDGSIYIYKRR
jgi:spore cortex formation protein SpoVR/YcgB (stage V sporulation)